ncbi:MAG TPA: type II 3-dehydroquinate dehydratase [Atribacteraceae bacterium]|nr:type II 3-dehydroquinate dehydratase [Atribacteraceae bacterium]
MKLLFLFGPNLNLLGSREPAWYGTRNFEWICETIQREGKKRGVDVTIFQSNHEGAIIDRLHSAREEVDGIVFNPGAFTHYSLAIRDALQAVNIKTIEIHMSNIYQREEFRHRSVIAPVCFGQISGLGWFGYLLAMDAFLLEKDNR